MLKGNGSPSSLKSKLSQAGANIFKSRSGHAEPFTIPESLRERSNARSQGPQPKGRRLPGQRVELVQPKRSDIYRNPHPSSKLPNDEPTKSKDGRPPTRPRGYIKDETEAAVNDQVPTSLGLSLAEPIMQLSATQRADAFRFIPATITKGAFRSHEIELLWSAMNDVLPRDPLNFQIVNSVGGLNYHQWNTIHPDGVNRMHLGWHLLVFSFPVTPSKILPDGTDSRFLPGPAHAWPYRLWNSGLLKLNPERLSMLDMNKNPVHFRKHMVERPIEVRFKTEVLDSEGDTRAFVRVRKEFHAIAGRILQRELVTDDLMKILARRWGDYYYDPVLEEEYTLCFLRKKPVFLGDPPRLLKTPREQPKFAHTFIPNRHLLFCWSALTQNAHLIHLDPTYAREQYGAPNLLVQGPLTVFLMLEWFHRELTRHAVDQELPKFDMISFEYNNLQPLFVDEPMTLCARPSQFPEPGTLAPEWSVWIEKATAAGQRTMAFKGTIQVLANKEEEGKDTEEQIRQSEDEVEGEDGVHPAFEDPYFRQ